MSLIHRGSGAQSGYPWCAPPARTAECPSLEANSTRRQGIGSFAKHCGHVIDWADSIQRAVALKICRARDTGVRGLVAFGEREQR